MKKNLKAIPEFKTEAEERRFWEEHDSTQYVDWSGAKPARFPNLKPSTQSISLRFPDEHTWSRLSPLQVGRYAEYFVMMEFTKRGFQVYSSEVDDRGIDFVIRKNRGHFYEIQVKSLRTGGYTFCEKKKMILTHERLVALCLFEDGYEPKLYLIPSLEWRQPTALLTDKNYEGKKSKPEWGVNVSKKNLPLLEEFSFRRVVSTL